MEGAALIAHLKPGHSFVRDEVSRVRKNIGLGSLTQSRSRAQAMEVCRHLYDGLQRHNFAYEVEPRLLGLSIKSTRGRVFNLIAGKKLKPLYACLRVRDPLFGKPEVEAVRGVGEKAGAAFVRPSIDDLLES